MPLIRQLLGKYLGMLDGNMDGNRKNILKLFKEELSPKEARPAFNRWRIFFLACAETFRFRNGQEWWISHYLFKKP